MRRLFDREEGYCVASLQVSFANTKSSTVSLSAVVVISRHLCVCRHCLVHIDKCPVCRTGFDEYVAISEKEKSTIKIPYHKKTV
jgi:hypothetical protein